jgi:hypothetical protein
MQSRTAIASLSLYCRRSLIFTKVFFSIALGSSPRSTRPEARGCDGESPFEFHLEQFSMKAQFAGPDRAAERRHFWTARVERLLRLPNLFWILFVFTCPVSFAQTKFYSVVDIDLTPYANGALIRSEPIAGAPDGAAAYRVLYKSEGLHGGYRRFGCCDRSCGTSACGGPSNRRVGASHHGHRSQMRSVAGACAVRVDPGLA